MGKAWDENVPDAAIWAEALRVLKPGGHVLAFAGTRTQHRMACNIEDAGFEIRDMLAWIYGSGFPKSHNGPWGGTALKPALEPITMARKPLVGTVAANFAEYGTGALNIDACRVGTETRTTKWSGTANYKVAIARDGESVCNGRWPANLLHDGSEEVTALFPMTGASRAARRGALGKSPFSGIDGSGRDDTNGIRGHSDAGGSAARFFYCAKASKRERGESNTHPTVKPIALMEYLVQLASRPGAVVLDPFMGSGTTGIACRNLGREFIGIEMNEEYMEIAKRRLGVQLAEDLF